VSHRLRKLATALILTAVVACPVLEMFDQWDDTTRTGNDTETAIVVVVLCVGAALIGAQIVVRPSTHSSSRVDADCVTPRSFFVGVFGRPSPIPAVSPPAILRV
jgi:hypothetical protein